MDSRNLRDFCRINFVPTGFGLDPPSFVVMGYDSRLRCLGLFLMFDCHFQVLSMILTFRSFFLDMIWETKLELEVHHVLQSHQIFLCHHVGNLELLRLRFGNALHSEISTLDKKTRLGYLTVESTIF